jgi:hypothetical protein
MKIVSHHLALWSAFCCSVIGGCGTTLDAPQSAPQRGFRAVAAAYAPLLDGADAGDGLADDAHDDLADDAADAALDVAIASPEGGVGDSGPATISFTFAIEGAPALIRASAVADETGRITIDSYPSLSTEIVTYGFLPAGFALSASSCASVRAWARAATQGGPLASLYQRLVRESGAAPLIVPVSPFVGPTFTEAVESAARMAGVPGSALEIENPLVVDRLALAMAFDDDAISNILGGTDAIVASLAARLRQTESVVARFGNLDTALAAKDVLCDLADGRASIILSVHGSAAGVAYSGTTRVTGLRPL